MENPRKYYTEEARKFTRPQGGEDLFTIERVPDALPKFLNDSLGFLKPLLRTKPKQIDASLVQTVRLANKWVNPLIIWKDHNRRARDGELPSQLIHHIHLAYILSGMCGRDLGVCVTRIGSDSEIFALPR